MALKYIIYPQRLQHRTTAGIPLVLSEPVFSSNAGAICNSSTTVKLLVFWQTGHRIDVILLFNHVSTCDAVTTHYRIISNI